jgi:SagB-type dehydrogenase family enzyme
MVQIKLPEPLFTGEMSLEKAINERHSIRRYKNEPLFLREISQLLWACQGMVNEYGFRTVPSAGAIYPVEVYLSASNVNDLSAGVYKYHPQDHSLELIVNADKKTELCKAAKSQPCVSNAAANIIFCGDYNLVEKKYGIDRKNYIEIEVGCASQNLHLQATALELGTVFIAGFNPDEVGGIIECLERETPICIMPIGKK